MQSQLLFARYLSIFFASVMLTACGRGSSEAPANGNIDTNVDWIAGQFLDADTFAGRCVVPRAELDPVSNLPVFNDIQGSLLDENNWLRSWSEDLYLWYSEIPDQDPEDFTDTLSYFETLKTSALTSSGNAKDRFHFTFDSAQWQSLSQFGVLVGYGAEFALLSGTPPREIVVAFTQPNSPATAPGVDLVRGSRIIGVDGVDAVNGDTQSIVDTLNAAIFPTVLGQQHSFEVVDPGSTSSRFITMTTSEIITTPVQHTTTLASPSGATVGYFLFNDHIATAESQLVTAIETLQAASIEDLIVDLRYNGGGFLGIASELAYMIAGSTATAGRSFETLQFNDKHPATNPVTGAFLTPLPFASATIGYSSLPTNTPLPTLDLARVFVITSAETCSASESIINSLRGVGIEVIQIGTRTCGKPYGFYPTDNCGTTYFSIQFRGVNELGFGDYGDGFVPSNGVSTNPSTLPGCIVADDFANALGTAAEQRIQTALEYSASGNCIDPVSSPVQSTVVLDIDDSQTKTSFELRKPPIRNNRLLGK